MGIMRLNKSSVSFLINVLCHSEYEARRRVGLEGFSLRLSGTAIAVWPPKI
jgi:hypothetical protein